MEDLERRVARAAGSPAMLVLFDLNGFKNYNDTFGHLAGDALLKRLSSRLELAVAPMASVYRLGGDEFCVLADAAGAEEIERAAHAALREQGEGFDVTAASGIGLDPRGGRCRDRGAAPRRSAHVRGQAGQRVAAPSTSRKDVLIRVLAERHPDLGDHLNGVAELAEGVARRLGLEDQELAQVRHAAELHDIGKVAIPDSILEKPGPLDDEEWAFMRRHTIIGERILAAAPALAPVGRAGARQPRALRRRRLPGWPGAARRSRSARGSSPSATPSTRCSPSGPTAGPHGRRGACRAAPLLRRQFDPAVVAALVQELAARRAALPA